MNNAPSSVRKASALAFGTLLILSAWPGAASANRLEDIKQRGVLICGTQNASSPYGFQDPKTRDYVGYDVDMCHAIARQLGLKLQHKPLSTEARIPEVKLGRVDMVAGAVAWLPKRAEEVDFSQQYLQGNIKVLVRKDSGIKTLADLAGKKVCASSGSSSAAIAQKVLKGADVLTFQNISQCYLGLQNDKVAAMTAGELVLLRFANDSKSGDSPTELIAEPTYTEHIGVIVNKGEPQLKQAIDNAIVALDKSGELTRIYDKWMGPDSIYKLSRTFKVEPVDAAAARDKQTN
ncbi:transporter substrate-binding domain-containing protein [Pusillimonas sp. TS35]|jgi:polar amino acid transport system substrate-binding protein|uniref:ABC transporter substrate-binding protein n=1 Tax=Paracandidimonas lactea TaxID=2895524 RepID=UPI0013718BA9|nr:ABC transporter substrate-binding protein [Paracandidimonas lactea]MYN12802.1 transporter substrate-binding domain-containing protein [Pusillimonas sp. TS35]